MTKLDHNLHAAEAHAVEARLRELLARGRTTAHLPLERAVEYALLAQGKRLRPRMVMAIGGPGAAALDAGCAVEMVHTASLILDDLPCMDDAELRRGRPTAHRRFGEATAILAAVALITEAFEVLARIDAPANTRARLAQILAQTIGRNGMCSGQNMDLSQTAQDIDDVDRVNALKTATLFVAAAQMGAVLRGMDAAQMAEMDTFAQHFGRAFQLADDVLDLAESSLETGKDVGADDGKPTMDRVAGPEATGNLLQQHLYLADAALARAGLERSVFAPFMAGLGATVQM